MTPLNLTSKEQTVLANFCSFARSLEYQMRTNPDGVEQIKVVNNLLDIMNRADFMPTDYDAMYDKLHRTGSNS